MLAVIRYHELQKREGRCCSESVAGALRQPGKRQQVPHTAPGPRIPSGST